MKGNVKRGISVCLSAAMVLSGINLGSTQAAENDDTEMKIIGFEEVSRKYAVQTLDPGASEDEIRFPSSIWVKVAEEDEIRRSTASDADREERQALKASPSTPSQARERQEEGRERTRRRKIRDVGWELNFVESDRDEFDSGEAGLFVYEPVLPAGYELGEELELPQIRVQVKAAEGITTAGELKAELEKTKFSDAALTGDIELAEDVKLGESHMLTIQEDKTLTVGSTVDTNGKKLTLAGAGSVEVTDTGILTGRIYVGSGNNTDSVKLTVLGKIVSKGDLEIKDSGTVFVKEGATVEIGAANRTLKIESNGRLEGEDGAEIVLAEGAVIAGAAGVFNDQGETLNTDDKVTVAAADTPAKENQLTAGTYTWKDGAFCKEKTAPEGITTAEELKAELEKAAYSKVTLAGDITFDSQAELGANHMVEIPEGKTLTVTGKINTAKLLTLTGEGSVEVTGEGKLDGRIYVGEKDKDNAIQVYLKDQGSMTPSGDFTVWKGTEIIVGSPEGISVQNGKSISIKDGAKISGAEEGGIKLAEGAAVAGAAGVFKDQDKPFGEDGEVTVAAADTPAKENQLTAGTYIWKDGAFCKEKTAPEGITTAEELKAELEKAAYSKVTLAGDITFDSQAELGANHMVEIPQGMTLTVTGQINAANSKMLTLTGAGSVKVTGKGKLDGRISVGEKGKDNAIRICLEDEGSMTPDGDFTVRNGAEMIVGSPEGISVRARKSITVEDGAKISGTGEGGIELAEGAAVAGTAGVFSDQGKSFSVNDKVTVGPANAAAADGGLTAGVYQWNGTCFYKEEPEPLPPTSLKDGVLTLSLDKAGDKEAGWDWAPGEKTDVLNINSRLTGIKRIVFANSKPASIKVNGDVTLAGDGEGAAVSAAGSLTLRADSPYALTVNGGIKAEGDVTFINEAIVNIDGASDQALLEAGGAIMIKNNSSVTVENTGEGPAVSAGGAITVKDTAAVRADGSGGQGAMNAGGTIAISGTAQMTVYNRGEGPALNKAPETRDYEQVRISASKSSLGRPVAEYKAEEIENYKYLRIRRDSGFTEDATVSQVEQVLDTLTPEDFDEINDVVHWVYNAVPAEQEALKPETIKKLDALLQEATGIRPQVRLETAAGIEYGKQIQNVEIYGALLAAGMDVNTFGNAPCLEVRQTETAQGAAATFVCSLTLNGEALSRAARTAGLKLPVTLRVELPPEYFPLSEDQIHQTGDGVDRWIDFVYDGSDNTAEFQTDILSTFSLVRKGEAPKPGTGGGNSGGGGSSSGGKASGGPGQNMAKEAKEGQWMRNETGWWYQYADGTYPVNGWFQLDYQGKDEWYYFNQDGYMATGWILSDGKWYYLNPVSDGTLGKMLTGWQMIGGKWYYLNETSDGTKGAMAVDAWIGGYYVNKDGIWEKK